MDAERLDQHKKILGVIYIVSASLTLLVALFVKAVLDIVFGFAFEEMSGEEIRVAEFVRSITAILPAVIIIFSVIPTMIAGIGLMAKASWAPIVALIVGCLKLFSIPVGTVIGVYAIWIYVEDQKLSKSTTAK